MSVCLFVCLLLPQVVKASREGVHLYIDEDDEENVSRKGAFVDINMINNRSIPMERISWDWPNAFFFATTVVTTIGM